LCTTVTDTSLLTLLLGRNLSVPLVDFTVNIRLPVAHVDGHVPEQPLLAGVLVCNTTCTLVVDTAVLGVGEVPGDGGAGEVGGGGVQHGVGGVKVGVECFDKKQTVVQDAPKEQCSLEPQRTCKHVTKLVPKLEPTEECVDVPKEVCTRARTNPRKVKKPVVKKWCYVPSEESGLA